jgi:ribonuclease R
MLPLELSTGICSLRPNEDRLVMSAELEIDNAGDVVAQSFTRGIIRSAARMTYTSVHRILEGDEAERQVYAHLVPHFEHMRELALILNRKRTRRGSIDFDLPESLIEFDENGLMTGVARAPRNIAHRIIEEFMLSANEAVAAHIAHAAVPSLYRIHEIPDVKKVHDFEEIASQFGYTLAFGALPVKKFGMVDKRRDGRKVRRDIVMADERANVTSRNYQKLIAKIEGKPESASSATSCSAPSSRPAIATKTKATSPSPPPPTPTSLPPSAATRTSWSTASSAASLTISRQPGPKSRWRSMAPIARSPNAAPARPNAIWSSGKRSSS